MSFMKASKLLGVLACFSFPAGLQLAHAGELDVTLPGIDVVGLRLGMTPEEAGEILKAKGYVAQKPSTRSYGTLAYKTRFSNEAVLPETKRLISSEYLKQDTLKTDKLIIRYPLAPNKSEIYAIDRTVTYEAKESSPSKEKILTAIQSKYGKESRSTKLSIDTRTWLYDEKGSVIQINSRNTFKIQSSCMTYGDPDRQYESNAPKFVFSENNNPLPVVDNFGKCHARLEVGISSRENETRGTTGTVIHTTYNSGAYLQAASKKTLAFIKQYIQKEVSRAEAKIKNTDAPEF